MGILVIARAPYTSFILNPGNSHEIDSKQFTLIKRVLFTGARVKFHTNHLGPT